MSPEGLWYASAKMETESRAAQLIGFPRESKKYASNPRKVTEGK